MRVLSYFIMGSSAENVDFRQAVKLYIELHDEIQQAARDMKEVRKRKDALGETILECMRKQDIEECHLPDDGGRLVRKSSKRTESLKKEHILKELTDGLGIDATKAEETLNNIFSQRNMVVKETLSRVKK